MPIPFNARRLGGLELWFAADAFAGLADGAAVAAWPDLSGNARDATQATGPARPTWRAGVRAGRPAVRFDGTDDYLSTPSFTRPASPTVFAVLSATSGGQAYGTPFAHSDDSGYELRISGGVPFEFNVNGTAAAETTAGFGRVRLATGEGGTAYRVRLAFEAGTPAIGAFAVTPAVGSSAAYLGVRGDLASFTWFRGDLAELLVFSRRLGAREKRAVQRYLAQKYLLPGFPPVGLALALLAAALPASASGTLAATLGGLALSGSAAAAPPAPSSAALAATLGGVTLAGAGSAAAPPATTAALAATLGDFTVVATATAASSSGSAGALAATLGDTTLVGSGYVGAAPAAAGVLAATLGDITLVGSGVSLVYRVVTTGLAVEFDDDGPGGDPDPDMLLIEDA